MNPICPKILQILILDKLGQCVAMMINYEKVHVINSQ